jgi:hypothetical protein
MHKKGFDAEGNTRLSQFMEDAKEQIMTETQFKKLKQIIVRELQRLPYTRGNDTLLIYNVWVDFYHVRFPVSFKKLMSIPTPESITRCRRWINEFGVVIDGQVHRFLPRPETIAKRRRRQEVIKQIARYEKKYGAEYDYSL